MSAHPDLREAIARFNESEPILDLVDAHVDQRPKKVASTRGGEWASPCPCCGGTDRFRIWPSPPDGAPGAWCRRCEASGDTLTWAVRLSGRDRSTKGATRDFLLARGYLRPSSERAHRRQPRPRPWPAATPAPSNIATSSAERPPWELPPISISNPPPTSTRSHAPAGPEVELPEGDVRD